MRHNQSLLEAYQLVKRKRSVAAPNVSFMAQLCALEMKLNGSVSIDLERYSPMAGKVSTALPERTKGTSADGLPVKAGMLKLPKGTAGAQGSRMPTNQRQELHRKPQPRLVDNRGRRLKTVAGHC